MIPAQMSFSFERPLIAAAALIVIPLAALLARKLGSPFTASVPLGPPGGIPFKAPFNLGGIVKALRILEYCGTFLLFISAAGPLIKTSETVWLNRGADILFVLDISPSMAALDMGGASRFNIARELLKKFAERRPSDSIGLAAVGYDAALLVPPTTDHTLLDSRLEGLRIGEMGDGTALGMGLALAAYHLEKSTAPRRAVVLISDGENNAGAIHPETAAAMLKDVGVSLWVIGIGSGGEVPIDYVDPFTRIRRTGLFDSSYDTDALRKISSAGGGTLISAPSADALATAFTRLDDQEMVVRRAGTVTRFYPCYLSFMIAALGFIITVRFVKRFFLGAWL
ncbi:MAG: VWA domain-containing protein [Treponema sp.]|jgi:Ca-activated chloride channel family protein|nr:VWA domain-containing protein [Treponema sp.]